MVSGRCSGGSSSTHSPAAAAAVDQMVEKEIEAAEALADLAHLAMREGCCAAKSGGEWTRGGNRVKRESPPPAAESLTRCSDLGQDRIVSPEQSAKACGNVLAKPLKTHDCGERNLRIEKETELPKASLIGSTGYSPFGTGKSRRNLTEAEKEARRIRRILANRESARQTIRRRQALCEELTKKAADLASENESLKKEMEMALKLYRTLETKNKQLKDQVKLVRHYELSQSSSDFQMLETIPISQMAKVVKADVEDIPGGQDPACIQISPSTASPFFFYNHTPFTPPFWLPVTQSPNAVQLSNIPQNAIVMPSKIPLPAEGRQDSSEQENLMNISGRRMPFFILPSPWFFPHPDPGTSFPSQSSIFQKNEQDETSTNDQHSPTCSRTTPHEEHQHPFMHAKVKTEPFGSFEARTIKDLNEHPAEVAQDGGDQQTGSHLKGSISKETLVTPLLIKPVLIASTIKHENGFQLDSTPHMKTSTEVCHTPPATVVPESCEPIIYFCKKSAETVAAAKARKRRKELTKLKNLNGRQCQMHC